MKKKQQQQQRLRCNQAHRNLSMMLMRTLQTCLQDGMSHAHMRQTRTRHVVCEDRSASFGGFAYFWFESKAKALLCWCYDFIHSLLLLSGDGVRNVRRTLFHLFYSFSLRYFGMESKWKIELHVVRSLLRDFFEYHVTTAQIHIRLLL